MYFWNERKEKLVNKCPTCQADFIINKGAACSTSCPAKQLEVKHQKVASKMIRHCLGKKKIKIEFPLDLPSWMIFDENRGWGWTDDIKQIITIPWYTLRSKKEFFDTNLHEVGHINAYKEKFTLIERNILKKLVLLEEKKNKNFIDNDFDSFIMASREIRKIEKKNKKLIDRYNQWEGHEYGDGHSLWYQEYLKLFKKLFNSHYAKYAYGNLEPRPHEDC